MKKILSLLTLLIVAIGTSWATETAVSLVSYTVSDNTATCTNSDDENVTVVLSRTSGTLPGPDSKSRGLRWQANAVITATVPTGYKINSVKLTSGKNGNSVGKIVYTVTDGTSSLTGTWDNALNSGKQDSYTWTAGTGVTTTSWVLTNTGSTGDLYISAVTVTYEAVAKTAPEITTDLAATADVTVGVAEEFSIVATGATSYQWYNGENAIEGATSATYSYTAAAAGTVNIKCVASNAYGDTPSTVCAVTATAPADPPVITTNLEAAYNVIKGQTQELSIVAEDASSYQWYLDGVAVEGATTDTYTFTAGSTIGATNAVYCKAINAAGTTNSVTATITTVGRADCELTNIKFSNGAYGAISNFGSEDLTVQVPYMAGTEAPTVEEASINISDGATYVLSGNTLTVTAEDETTSKEFTINAVEITPLNVSADVTENFTEVPSWVFNLYGYDETKGVKFAKAVNDAGNMRIAKGNTRQYYFIGAAKSLTLTAVEKIGKNSAVRKVNVYVNGTKVISDTENNALGAIALDENAPCMVMIEAAAGTNGDGGFSAYAIEAAAPTTETITIPSDGVLTYVTQNALDFSTINGAFKAYVPTSVNEAKTSVATVEVTSVPAGTALLLKGAAGAYDVEIAESATAPAANLFQVSDGSVAGGDNIFAYSKTNKKFQKVKASVTIPAGKCYLVIEGVSGDALDLDFEGEATAIENVNANENANAAAPVKVIKNGKLYIGNYNVAGQLVK